MPPLATRQFVAPSLTGGWGLTTIKSFVRPHLHRRCAFFGKDSILLPCCPLRNAKPRIELYRHITIPRVQHRLFGPFVLPESLEIVLK